MKFNNIAMLALVGAAVIGCAKDKNLDDYRQEQLNTNLSNLQMAAGSYRGNMVDSQTSKSMSNIQIDLQAVTVPVPSPDNSGTRSQAILQGKVSLNDGLALSSAKITSADFSIADSKTNVGNFSGKITVTVNNQTSTLSMSGVINGATFTGDISNDDRPGHKGHFTAVRNAPLPPPANGQPSTGPKKDPADLGRFAGTSGTRICNGEDPCSAPLKVSMALRAFFATSDEMFLNVFALQKYIGIDMIFDFGNGVPIPVAFDPPSAQIDYDAGRIKAQKTYSSTIPALLTLECSQKKLNEKDMGWDCIFKNNNNLTEQKFVLAPLPPQP